MYNPIRQEFKTWLRELGVQPTEIAGTDEGTKLERELRRILDDVPELTELFGFRTRKAILQPDSSGMTNASLQEGIEGTFPVVGKVRQGKDLEWLM